VTVEFKTPDPASESMDDIVRDARRQALHLVIDVRGKGDRPGLAKDVAIRQLASAMRNRGKGLLEVLMIGDGWEVEWP
jgi:hypothetical protein